ncbi:MAG: TrmH family RNA methyltransferase [Eubacteriales bacterium]
MKILTSGDNAHIKLIQKLKMKKYRDRNGQYLLEGFRLIDEALISSQNAIDLFISTSLQDDVRISQYLDASKAQVYWVDEGLFSKISSTDTTQGILAICTMEEYKDIKGDYILLLDRIQDPGNLGTIIRTADAAGFSEIVCSKGCVDVYNPKTIRSTMGSIFHIHISQDHNLSQYIETLSADYKIIGTSLETNKRYDHLFNKGKYALIIGNEGEGIQKELLKLCHHVVKIPIYGKAESLNASVAAGIMMYHLATLR